MKNLFYSLPLSLRLTLISVAFMIPIIAMLCITLRGINEDLFITQLEQQGTQVVRPLINLQEAVPLHLQLSRRLIQGDASVTGEISLLQTRIDSAVRGLETAAERLFAASAPHAGGNGEAPPPVEAIQLAWSNLKAQTRETASYPTLAEQHAQILGECRRLLRRTGQESHLLLDPALDSWELVHTAIETLPSAQKRLFRAITTVTAKLDAASPPDLGGETVAAPDPDLILETRVLDHFLRQEHLPTLQSNLEAALRSDEHFNGLSRSLQENLPPAIEVYQQALHRVPTNISAADPTADAARWLTSARAAQGAGVALWRTLVAELDALLAARINTYQRARLGAFLLSLFAVIAAWTFVFFITRSILWPLRAIMQIMGSSGDQVTAAGAHLVGSSQNLAEASSEQAASLEETGAALEEMASMTKRNSENAQSAEQLTSQTRAAADSGARDMRSMIGAMDAIKTSSSNIAKIVKSIDEIAFQTNILALNAAVEAARAGEAGMGFGVVADEVRNLAQRSAEAARETAALIDDSIQKSDQGVEISGQAAARLEEIVGKVRQVDELVAAIASASKEQSLGIEQINLAVAQMDKVTQTNANSAQESAHAAQELNSQATAMKTAVEQLQRLAGGGRTRKRTLTAPHENHPVGPTDPTAPQTFRISSNGKGLQPVVTPDAKPARTWAPMDSASAWKETRSATPDSFKDF